MQVYQLRPVLLTDIPCLSSRCWPEQSLQRAQWRIERAVTQMQFGRMVGLVATSDRRSVPDPPFAYGQLTRWTRLAEISDLVVTEEWRNQGIGTAIIAALIAHARIWGVHQVEIGVAERNTRAFDLYRRLGFNAYRSVMFDLGEGEEPVIYLIQDLIQERDSAPD